MIHEAGFDDTFYYFGNERLIGDWPIVWEFFFVQCRFLEQWWDSLRVGWNWPKMRERLTILVIVETRTDEHSLRSQVGIGSESDCLFGQLERICWTQLDTGFILDSFLVMAWLMPFIWLPVFAVLYAMCRYDANCFLSSSVWIMLVFVFLRKMVCMLFSWQ